MEKRWSEWGWICEDLAAISTVAAAPFPAIVLTKMAAGSPCGPNVSDWICFPKGWAPSLWFGGQTFNSANCLNVCGIYCQGLLSEPLLSQGVDNYHKGDQIYWWLPSSFIEIGTITRSDYYMLGMEMAIILLGSFPVPPGLLLSEARMTDGSVSIHTQNRKLYVLLSLPIVLISAFGSCGMKLSLKLPWTASYIIVSLLNVTFHPRK